MQSRRQPPIQLRIRLGDPHPPTDPVRRARRLRWGLVSIAGFGIFALVLV